VEMLLRMLRVALPRDSSWLWSILDGMGFNRPTIRVAIKHFILLSKLHVRSNFFLHVVRLEGAWSELQAI
jgi:hypothetical protein